MTTTVPQFLVLEIPDAVAARAVFPAVGTVVREHGGTLLAAALPRSVEVLEAGSRLAAVLIARWDAAAQLDACWRSPAARAAFAPAHAVRGTRAISVRGIPTEGLPGNFLPTVATVQAPALATPPPTCWCQGSMHNLAPIETYVGIIMPKLRERRGYYVVYAEAPDVSVLHGEWGRAGVHRIPLADDRRRARLLVVRPLPARSDSPRDGARRLHRAPHARLAG